MKKSEKALGVYMTHKIINILNIAIPEGGEGAKKNLCKEIIT